MVKPGSTYSSCNLGEEKYTGVVVGLARLLRRAENVLGRRRLLGAGARSTGTHPGE